MSTVVILLSDKRSGSTMFEREICHHPDIHHVSFTPHTYNETHYWLQAACLLPTPRQLFSSNKPCNNYGSKAGIRKSLIETIRGNVPEFIVPGDDESLVFDGWEALCKRYANPVFFEKSPQHPHHWAALDLMLRWAERTTHRVRFIGLVRNPMSVMYSARALFFTNPVNRQFGWSNAYRNILLMKTFLSEDQFYFVRYEDLTHYPLKYFGEICDFIGVSRDPAIGASVHEKSLTKWKDDPSFDLRLHDCVQRVARQCGYVEDDILQKTGSTIPSVVKLKTRLGYQVKRGKMRIINGIKRFIKRVVV